MLGPKSPSEYSGISFTSEEMNGSEFVFYLENKQKDTIVSLLKFSNEYLCPLETNKLMENISARSIKKSQTIHHSNLFLK